MNNIITTTENDENIAVLQKVIITTTTTINPAEHNNVDLHKNGNILIMNTLNHHSQDVLIQNNLNNPENTTTNFMVNNEGIIHGTIVDGELHQSTKIISQTINESEEHQCYSDNLAKLTKICRFCLSERPNLQSIFDNENCIPEMIMALASVVIFTGDSLPAQICMQCVLQLSRALSFKQQIETADATLRHFIGQGYLEGMKLPSFDEDSNVDLLQNDNNETIIKDVDDQTGDFDHDNDDDDDDDDDEIGNTINVQVVTNNGVDTGDQQFIENNQILNDQINIITINEPIVSINENNIIVENSMDHTNAENEIETEEIINNIDSGNNKKGDSIKYVIEDIEESTNSCLNSLNNEQMILGSDEVIIEDMLDDESLLHPLPRHPNDSIFDDCGDFNNEYEDEDEDVEDCREEEKNNTTTADVTDEANKQESILVNDIVDGDDEDDDVDDNDGDHDDGDDNGDEDVNGGDHDVDDDDDDDDDDGDDDDVEDEDDDDGGDKVHDTEENGEYNKSNEIESSSTSETTNTQTDSSIIKEKTRFSKRFIAQKQTKEMAELHLFKIEKPRKKQVLKNITDELNLTCSVCNKVFTSSRKLSRHHKIHLVDKPYGCVICNKGFTERADLKRHIQRHIQLNDNDDDLSTFNCLKCNLRFNNDQDLQLHLSIHRDDGKFVCGDTQCGKEFSTNIQLKRHVRTHFVDKPHKCSVCNKGFPERGSLTRHFRRHLGEVREKKYVCKFCGKKYCDSHSLNVHTRTHTGERPWTCPICGKGFIDSRLLNSHVKVHSSAKPYQCSYCDTRFAHQSTLTTHIRTHTGEKPYVCSLCGKTFIQSSNLSLHMRVHSGDKPYKCEVCDRRFASSSSLTVHNRIHTGEKPYDCKICHKRFARHDVTVHMRTHTGEKPFKCTNCDKRFTTSGQLSQHIRSHTGEKPFICDICQKRCSSSSYLKKHKQYHCRSIVNQTITSTTSPSSTTNTSTQQRTISVITTASANSNTNTTTTTTSTANIITSVTDNTTPSTNCIAVVASSCNNIKKSTDILTTQITTTASCISATMVVSNNTINLKSQITPPYANNEVPGQKATLIKSDDLSKQKLKCAKVLSSTVLVDNKPDDVDDDDDDDVIITSSNVPKENKIVVSPSPEAKSRVNSIKSEKNIYQSIDPGFLRIQHVHSAGAKKIISDKTKKLK